MFARPKYTAEKLSKIREVIHNRRRDEINVEKEKQRKEEEKEASKETDLGKRKQEEEEEEKKRRLTELKSKAESLRQEKSTLFGMLKQALLQEAKKKEKDEREEKMRKEEQDKKDKKERAMAEAAQALAGATSHPGAMNSGLNPMLSAKMGMGGMGSLPGMMGYGQQANGFTMSPRQGFYGTQTQEGARGVASQGAGRLQPFPPSQPGGYASPHAMGGVGGIGGIGGVARGSMLNSLGQNQRLMNMQAYQNQNAMLAGRMGGGGGMGGQRGFDNRPPQPPTAPPDHQQGGQHLGVSMPGMQGGRGRGFPNGRGGFGYQGSDRRW